MKKSILILVCFLAALASSRADTYEYNLPVAPTVSGSDSVRIIYQPWLSPTTSSRNITMANFASSLSSLNYVLNSGTTSVGHLLLSSSGGVLTLSGSMTAADVGADPLGAAAAAAAASVPTTSPLISASMSGIRKGSGSGSTDTPAAQSDILALIGTYLNNTYPILNSNNTFSGYNYFTSPISVAQITGYGGSNRWQTSGTITYWGGIPAVLDVEGENTLHGIMSHVYGSQGNAIIGYSQSGGCGLKAYQDTHGTCDALFVGRATANGAPWSDGSTALPPVAAIGQLNTINASLLHVFSINSSGADTADFWIDGSCNITTTGSASVSAIKVGSVGSPVQAIYSGTASLTVPSLTSLSSTTVNITVAGASTTNIPTVEIGTASAAMPAGVVVADKWVSGANTVTLKFLNVSSSTSSAGGAVVFRASVTQF